MTVEHACANISPHTGLFSVTSIGLGPFRIVDTYRASSLSWLSVTLVDQRTHGVDSPGVCKIWYYQRKTEKLRLRAGLPELYDPNDLPDPHYDANYIPVLTEQEQIDLHYREYVQTFVLAVF